jgi:cysteinyl-tRNA synthetase
MGRRKYYIMLFHEAYIYMCGNTCYDKLHLNARNITYYKTWKVETFPKVHT